MFSAHNTVQREISNKAKQCQKWPRWQRRKKLSSPPPMGKPKFEKKKKKATIDEKGQKTDGKNLL